MNHKAYIIGEIAPREPGDTQVYWK